MIHELKEAMKMFDVIRRPFLCWIWLSFIILALLILCSSWHILSQRTRLPLQRPPEFELEYYGRYSGGTWNVHFQVSTDECTYSRHEKYGESVNTLCTISTAEIDKLYTLLRETRFDRMDPPFLSLFCISEGGATVYIRTPQIGFSRNDPDICHQATEDHKERWNTIATIIEEWMLQIDPQGEQYYFQLQ